MGRPPKATSEQKVAIVDQFYITNPDDSTTLLSSHGVYRRLSEYAKISGYSLEPHDFSRDEKVRSRINQLIESSVTQENTLTAVPTYEPLDITALMMSGKTHIEQILHAREDYYLKLHLKATRAIENYALVNQQANQYKAEMTAEKSKNAELKAHFDDLSSDFLQAKKDVAYLKKIIKNNIEPENAQRFLTELAQSNVAQKVMPFVTSDLRTLTATDMRFRKEAQAEIDMLDLNSLFVK